MFPLLLMLQDAPMAIPAKLDLRDWHSVETTEVGNRACTFTLSPNFYGIALRYTGQSDDIEISFDSPGVHILPTNIPIPLKVFINGEMQQVKGSRVDRKLFFRLDREAVHRGIAKRGMIRIMLSDPSIRDTLIARYRLRGADYEGSAARFHACNDQLRRRPSVTIVASGR